MEQTYTRSEKWRQFLVIFTPVVISQLMLFSMALIDTMMSGHYSNEALAGTAIGNSLWGPFNASLSGLLMAVTPIIAQLLGRGEHHDIKRTVNNGLYIAIGLATLLLTLNFLFVPSILQAMGLEPAVADIAKHFLNGICFGIPAFFFYSVLRAFIDSLGLTRITMMITLITVPVNIFLNYLLIFGNWGFPEMGGAGSGYATGITYWIVLLVTIILIQSQKRLRDFHIFSGFVKFDWGKIREIIKLGVPNGLTILFEVSIFSAVTVFMGRFGTDTIAAHQSAISVPTLLYAFPLSIAAALTILVGFETGAKRIADAKKYRHIGMISAISIGVLNGVLLLVFRDQISLLYTSDPKLADLITHFLIYAVLFQFADALLSPVLGALRGYKDVMVTSIVAFISYWVIGLPLGLLLSYTNLGPFGFWIGLSAGLFIAAIILSIRVRFTERKLIQF
ncbi:MATE family efflux transporter [Listeria rocourtiae]|uniref:MATE family efflux transporter n=1 Tax=Listeria rocourtiae TaxID=647910 RepID=UPI00162A92DA|nr:MATE family efflux transporter [Listeria rocourtiae]MBC1435874.1 MATE family efflux transporter [Listeria rocourtiae]